MPSLKFTIWGQAPSKGNYRWKNNAEARRRWKRIKDFEAEVKGEAMARGAARKRRGFGDADVVVKTMCYRQRADAGNIAKGVVDAMKGVCYNDDKDVKEINETARDAGRARVEVTVTWRKVK